MARDAVERTETSVTILKHRPTPLAKTVFGKEVHFRLQAGRIVYVPIDELVEMFQSEAKEKAWKLKQAPRITETVGPYRGFHLQYTLKRGSYTVETRAGSVQQSLVELDHFILIPVQEGMGETIEQALRPESDMRTHPGRVRSQPGDGHRVGVSRQFRAIPRAQGRAVQARLPHRQPPVARRSADQRLAAGHPLGSPVSGSGYSGLFSINSAPDRSHAPGSAFGLRLRAWPTSAPSAWSLPS